MLGRFNSVFLFASLLAIAFAANYASETTELTGDARSPASLGAFSEDAPVGISTIPILKRVDKDSDKPDKTAPKSVRAPAGTHLTPLK